MIGFWVHHHRYFSFATGGMRVMAARHRQDE
jgi:hypothetical protein